MLITIDGHSGAGKSTQLKRLIREIPTLTPFTMKTNERNPIDNTDSFLKLFREGDVITDWYINHFVYTCPPIQVPLRLKELGLPFNHLDCFHFVLLLDSSESSIKRVKGREGKWCGDVERHNVTFRHTLKFYEELIEMNYLTGVNAMKPIQAITNELLSKVK